MTSFLKWACGVALAVAIVGVPVLRYRMIYFNEKRFREVSDGHFYRCGQMSESGLRKQLRDHHIKTVINLQDENQDPKLSTGYWDKAHITESRICEEEGVKYIFLTSDDAVGLLTRYEATPDHRPRVIDDFLKICDDPANHPILLHCLAGLHRTGLLTAIYRMEYDAVPLDEAVRELRSNGFGDRKCTTDNVYIYEYLMLYKPRRGKGGPAAQEPGS